MFVLSPTPWSNLKSCHNDCEVTKPVAHLLRALIDSQQKYFDFPFFLRRLGSFWTQNDSKKILHEKQKKMTNRTKDKVFQSSKVCQGKFIADSREA